MRARQLMLGMALGAVGFLGGAQAQTYTPAPQPPREMTACGGGTCTVYYCTTSGCLKLYSYKQPRTVES